MLQIVVPDPETALSEVQAEVHVLIHLLQVEDQLHHINQPDQVPEVRILQADLHQAGLQFPDQVVVADLQYQDHQEVLQEVAEEDKTTLKY